MLRMLRSSVVRRALSTAGKPSVPVLPSQLSPPAGADGICRGIGRMTQLVFERAQGSWVWTEDGGKFLDMTCGIGVTNTGHSHPKVVSAVQEQVGKLVHGQVNIAYHRPMLDLIAKFKEHNVMPDAPPSTGGGSSKLDTFFFWNSGAEAVEAAIKLARQATGRQGVLVFQGGYHGRTIGTMSLTTSKNIYRAGFGPLMPGVFVAPFPYTNQWRRWFDTAGRCPRHGDSGEPVALSLMPEGERAALDERCAAHAIHEARLLLKQQAAAGDIAAVLIEPVQGEGGYVAPPPVFLRMLRELCDETGMLLIADEVQSGFGRTGTHFACQQFDLRPDILVFAKGVASGFPLSGIASTRDLMDKQAPGSMGGTYGGNAVSCAAALATLEVMIEEDLLTNTQARGAQLREGLLALQSRLPSNIISDVRGLGLMIGLEFFDGQDGGHNGISARVSAKCLDKGMLLLTTSVFETLRFIPALNVTEDEIELALNIFEEAIDEVVAELQ